MMEGESLYLMMILSFLYSCLWMERWGMWMGEGEEEEEGGYILGKRDGGRQGWSGTVI
jgi:hypothetical protein